MSSHLCQWEHMKPDLDAGSINRAGSVQQCLFKSLAGYQGGRPESHHILISGPTWDRINSKYTINHSLPLMVSVIWGSSDTDVCSQICFSDQFGLNWLIHVIKCVLLPFFLSCFTSPLLLFSKTSPSFFLSLILSLFPAKFFSPFS